MKKIIISIVVLLATLGLISCGNDIDNAFKEQLNNATSLVECKGKVSFDKMDVVRFGKGEDGDLIEWIVVEKDGSKAFLLSKYILTSHNYNDTSNNVTWEKSSVRKWLNDEYINKMFSKSEQELIIKSNVANLKNDYQGTNGGKDTKDKLFLLSIDEFNKYTFNSSDTLNTKQKNGDSIWWFLRSPGGKQNYAATSENGYGSPYGKSVTEVGGIRPAMWIKY